MIEGKSNSNQEPHGHDREDQGKSGEISVKIEEYEDHQSRKGEEEDEVVKSERESEERGRSQEDNAGESSIVMETSEGDYDPDIERNASRKRKGRDRDDGDRIQKDRKSNLSPSRRDGRNEE